MKSIERKDTGEDWNEYLTRLMKEAGLLDDRDDDDPPVPTSCESSTKPAKTSLFPTTSGKVRPTPTAASRRGKTVRRTSLITRNTWSISTRR